MSRLDQRDQRGLVSWTTCNLLRFSSIVFGYNLGSARLREKIAKRSSSFLSARGTLIVAMEVPVRFANMDTLLGCESNSYLWWFERSDLESTLHRTLASEWNLQGVVPLVLGEDSLPNPLHRPHRGEYNRQGTNALFPHEVGLPLHI